MCSQSSTCSASKEGEEVVKSRLDKIVDETKEPRVVVLGKLELGKTEAQTLGSFDSTMSRYEGEIQLGCADLGGVIEMRMREHLGRQLPELRKAVLTARDDKNARKKDLLVRDPREPVLNVVEKVRDVTRDSKAQKEAFLHDQRDAIMVGVKNAHVILGETDICHKLANDDLGDHIYVGGDILYETNKKVDMLEVDDYPRHARPGHGRDTGM
jgi:hypothetical protein